MLTRLVDHLYDVGVVAMLIDVATAQFGCL